MVVVTDPGARAKVRGTGINPILKFALIVEISGFTILILATKTFEDRKLTSRM